MAEKPVYQSFFNRSIIKLELRLTSVEKTQLRLGTTLEQTNAALKKSNRLRSHNTTTVIVGKKPEAATKSKRQKSVKKRKRAKEKQKFPLTRRKKSGQSGGDGLDQLWKKSLAVKKTFDDAYDSGTNGIERAQASANTFSKAWQSVNTNLDQGKGFFGTIKQVSPLIGQGLTSAKQSFSILGSSLAKAKQGIGQAGNALKAWKDLFSKKDQPDNANKNKGKKKPPPKIANTKDPITIGSAWQQGLDLKDNVTNTYDSGAKGVDQAQVAAGTFKKVWQQASQDMQQGKGFFNVLKSSAPLIGEGLNQAKESYTTLSSTVSQAKESFTQFKTIKENVSSFFSGSSEGSTSKNSKKGGKSTARKTKSFAAKIRPKFNRLKGLSFKGLGGLGKAASGVLRLGSSLASVATGALPALMTGMRAVGAAFLTNPIGLAITGIALAAGLIIRYWEPIKTFFSGLWDSIKPMFTVAWNWIKTIFSFSPIGILINNWSKISGFFSNIWGSIKGVFDAGITWIETKILAVFDPIKKVFGSIRKFFGGDDSDDDENKNAEMETASSHIVDIGTTRKNKLAVKKSKLVPAIALGSALATAPLAADTSINQNITYASPLQTANSAPAALTTKNVQYHININAVPGMNEQQLAQLIREQLEVHEQQQSLDNDRQLFD